MASVLRKLRVGVVAGAVLLVAVVAGFVWYGRLMARRFRLELPKRLGVNITQEADRFSYSQSSKGRTVFTVHAAKEIQRKDGTITLHDAGIELYGRQEGKADRISGQEFLFDQKRGLMTGVGEVFLDLAAPAGRGGKDLGAARTIHVKTSGLVFDQKAGTAVTEQRIEFRVEGMAGTAVGAEYDSKNGVVVLRSAVRVNGVERGRPAVLTAGRAEFERQQNLVVLEAAKYAVEGGKGAESAAAEHAQVHLAEDGTPREIDGQGRVTLSATDGGTMTGDRMEVALSGDGKPRTAHLWGGVQYASQTEERKAWGQAREMRVAFDGKGNPAHATADGAVTFAERTPDQERALMAARVELGFAEVGKGKAAVRDVDATGGASLRMDGVSGKGRSSTEVRGDELKGRFAEAGGKSEIAGLEGTGHTEVHQVSDDGGEETGKGETLEVSFRPGGKGKGGAAQIERAAQRGDVTIVRRAMAKKNAGSAGPQVEHASGEEAVYEAAGDRLTVTGGGGAAAEVQDANGVLLAERVTMEQKTGDAVAEGNVRVSYLGQDGNGEPLHIVAGRAVEKKSTGTAEFFGSAKGNARMWQGGSQVEAPVLSFSENAKDKTSRRMVAHGEMAGDADVVHAVLVSAAGKDAEPGSGKKSGGRTVVGGGRVSGAQGGVVRIVSHLMTYAEAAGTVEFEGRVKVEDGSGVLTAQKAVAYLAKGSPGEKAGGAKSSAAAARLEAGSVAAGGELMQGRVERVVASGQVEIEQPGRTGTGEQLVYTAGDRTFVLTGTRAEPPKVVDEAQGTTTGAVLRFRAGDNSVVVSGDGAGEKVRSESRVRK